MKIINKYNNLHEYVYRSLWTLDNITFLKGMRYSIVIDYGNESSWLPLSQNLTVHFSPTLFFTELLLYFYLIWLAESFHINFMKFTDMIETMSLQCVCENEYVCECNILVRVFSHLAVHLSTKNKLG